MKEEKNTLMAALAYLGVLVIVSYLVAKEDPFVKYHIKQGLVLLVIEVAMWVFMSFFWVILWHFWFIWQLLELIVLVLAVIGLVNAVQGKEKPLPVVGDYAKHFKI